MKDISLIYLLNLAWKRIIILIIAFVVFASVAFGYFQFVAVPVYEAKSSILLTNGGSLISSGTTDGETIVNTDIVASINMLDTYIDFLKEPEIYRRLAESNRYNTRDYTWQQLRDMVTISLRNDSSLFIDIKFQANDSDVAMKLTNGFAELTPEYFSGTFPYATVDVTSQAESATKVYPNPLTLTVVVGVLGAILAFGAVLVIDMMDQAIKGEEDYVSHYDVPLLGCVPYFESEASSSYNYGNYASNKKEGEA